MANTADGSIRIDTELDNSGFEKGSDKLLSSLKGIEGAVEAISDTLSDGFASVIKSLQSLTSNASTAYQNMRDEAQETVNANEQVVASTQNATQAMAQEGTGRRTASNYDSIYKSAVSLQDQLQRLATTASIGFRNEGQLQRFRDSVDVVARKVGDLREKMETLGASKIPTEGYASLQIELEKAKAELDALIKKEEEWDSLGFAGKGTVWDDLIEKEAEVSDRIDEIKLKMAEMVEAGTAFSAAPGFEQASAVVDGLDDKLNEVRAAGENAAAGLQQVGTQGQSLSIVSMFANSAGTAIANMGKSIMNTGIRAFHSTVNKLGSALKNAANNAKSAAKNLITFGNAAKAGKAPVDTLVRTLTSFKSLLITRIKRTFISSIFKELQEGVQNFARYSSEFNQAMTNIKNAGSQVAGNVAVTFANLITLIEPVVTKILGIINNLLTSLNGVFSLLTGKQVVPTATAQTGSYADSLDDASKSANKAAKSQKKYNAELYSYDELTRQTKKDDTSTGGAGSGNGISWQDSKLDDVLPQAVKDWAEKLKKLWQNGDYFNVGKHIASAMNAGLKKLDDWINNTFRPWGVKWAKNLAQVLNGIVAGLDWKLLGKTLSDGLAAVLDIGATFLETFNFAELGKGLSKALQGIFENKDMWNQLARFFSAAFNGMIDLAWGFIKESLPHLFDWGYTLSQTLSKTLASINWQRLAETIVLGIEGLCRFIEGWLAEKTHWEAFKQKFTDAFSYVVNNVDMARLGKDVSDLLLRVLDLIKGLDWYGFGRQIGTFIGSIDWMQIFLDVLNIVGNFLKGAITGFFSADHGWSSLFALLAFALFKSGGSILLTLLKAVVISKFMPSLAGVLLPGFKGAIVTVASGTEAAAKGTGLFSKIGSMISSGASSLVGLIKSWAPKIALAAGAVADAALLAYDTQALMNASQTYSQAQDAHNKEVETALNCFKRLYQTKGPEVAAEWAKTCYQIDTSGMSLEQGQKALTKKVDSMWDNVPQNMWQGFKQGFNYYFLGGGGNVIELVEDGFSGMIKGVTSLLGIGSPSKVFDNIGQNTAAGFKNGFSSGWSKVSSTFVQAWTNLRTSFGNIKWDVLGNNLVAGLSKGFGGAWSGLTTMVSSCANNLVSRIKSAFGISSPSKVFAEIGEYLDEGLEKGILSGQRDLLQTATQLAGTVTNSMTPDDPEVEMSVDDVTGEMSAVTSRLSEIAEVFRGIANTLASMGGLTVPQIAAGTVVPYKARVDGGTVAEEDSGAAVDSLARILTELQTLARTVTQNNGNSQTTVVPVNFNGKTLFEIVVDENNSAIMRYGSSPLKR